MTAAQSRSPARHERKHVKSDIRKGSTVFAFVTFCTYSRTKILNQSYFIFLPPAFQRNGDGTIFTGVRLLRGGGTPSPFPFLGGTPSCLDGAGSTPIQS